jgi:hypothetical protein
MNKNSQLELLAPQPQFEWGGKWRKQNHIPKHRLGVYNHFQISISANSMKL